MKRAAHKAVAIVGMGAVMPDARDLATFWKNIKEGKYSISGVPEDRWDESLYYDPDPKAPDKTYSRIGGWVKDWNWEPLKWKLPIPPKVSEAMDFTQIWSLSAVREALLDFGYPEKSFDTERTAVILGNAMGGDKHLYTAARILFPEFARELASSPNFSKLDQGLQNEIIKEMRMGVGKFFPDITEDTMPGELSNVVSGRIAALYNLRGPNYAVDAACASAMAAMTAAIEGLKALKVPCDVTLYSDSSYLVNAFTQNWIGNWKKNGWKNASKAPVSNMDLWMVLDGLTSIHRITWEKVKGHSDHPYNTRCDKLAVQATKPAAETTD